MTAPAFTLPLELPDIKRILPHRHPFLLVDRIVELEEDKRVVGIKNVASDERYFIAGPGGRPVMPASILTEAMAQAGAVLILTKPENRSRLVYFMGIDRVRYRRPVVAGDIVMLEATVVRLKSKMGSLKGVARVDGQRRLRGADDLRPGRSARPLDVPGPPPAATPPAGPGAGPSLAGARPLQVRRVLAQGGGPADRGGPGARRWARVVLWPLRRIDPRRQQVTVDGRAVGRTERVVLMLHKPRGYITSRTDPGGRPTVYSLLGDVGRWVFPVGRLDRDTTGLLILTNDHRLGQRLTDPLHHVPKTYHVRVSGVPAAEALRALREGATWARASPASPPACAAWAAPATAPGWRSCCARARTGRSGACARRWGTTCWTWPASASGAWTWATWRPASGGGSTAPRRRGFRRTRDRLRELSYGGDPT